MTPPPRPGDSRCEDMPKTTPHPSRCEDMPKTTPHPSRCEDMPKTTPHPPARPHGTAHGSRCGKRLSPHLRIPVITRSFACSRAPHATQRALSAHAQARSQPQPTVDRATGTAGQLYRYAAADPLSVSTSLHGYHTWLVPRWLLGGYSVVTRWLLHGYHTWLVPRGTLVDRRLLG